MRRLLAAAATAAALGGAAVPARAASVHVMVVGKHRVLRDARTVTLRARTLRVGHRRCRVAAGTPLAALAATRLRLGVRDYGSCGRSARDAGGLFVDQVGGERNRGRDGWVYKVGGRAGTAGSGDAGGPFGAGALRSGQQVLWFWCVMGRSGSCQRTLAVRAAGTVARRSRLVVAVSGYDDRGRGVPVVGATVRLGGASARTGRDGRASLVAPARRGRVRLTAAKVGTVRAFPREVTVR